MDIPGFEYMLSIVQVIAHMLHENKKVPLEKLILNIYYNHISLR
jgi:hypothetical protein